jgi:PAS domain S-box-containing protein
MRWRERRAPDKPERRAPDEPGQTTPDKRTVDPATLRESEIRYRELVEHMHSGVVLYEATAGGEDFIIRDFNAAAAQIERIAPQAVIGRPVTQAFPGVAEFGLLDVMRRVWKTGKGEHHPIARYQDERLSSWRENYVYRLPSGLVVAVYDDVTERKQVEEELAKFRLLATEARDIMLFVAIGDGAIVDANAAAEAAYVLLARGAATPRYRRSGSGRRWTSHRRADGGRPHRRRPVRD